MRGGSENANNIKLLQALFGWGLKLNRSFFVMVLSEFIEILLTVKLIGTVIAKE